MFDDIIKNRANEHEAPVPPDAWNNIVKKKKKRRFAFWWPSGALCLLLSLSSVGYFVLNTKTDNAIAKKEENSNMQTEQKVKETASATNETKKDHEAESILASENKGITTTTVEYDIAENSLTNKPQPVTVAGNAKTTVGIKNAVAEENELEVTGRNKKIKSIKGKLKAQQTTPGIDENIQANIYNPVAEEEVEEETGREESKRATVETVPGKKIALAEEEKKTSGTNNPEKPGLAKAEDAKKQEQTDKAKTAVAKQKIKKHWFIEAAAIPLLAASQYKENIPFNRTLAVNNSVLVYRANLTNASIEPAVAFSLLLRREVSKKITVGTGLQYMLLKENITIQGKETQTRFTVVDRLVNGRLVPDTLTTVTQGTRAISAVNSYQLFSIPVFVQYSIIQKPQWSVGAVGGFYFNISSNYKNEINRNAAAPLLPAPGTTNKSNTGMDIFAGIRVSKRLSKRLDFFAMPSIRLSLAKYNIKNSLLDKNINQAGVGFGLCYKIK